ncbi:globin [Paenibacillus chartarius]|uniref:Globin n=1 Tax=Paenibacillus chartarius TaxID=747481 RepID=A0ABV6DSH4_9BACL
MAETGNEHNERQEQEQTLYEQLGGEETVDRLVKAFYERVYRTPELIPLFQTDMQEVMEKQRLFLTQFLGGPAHYSMQYGPPRLRMRHLPFEITPARAQAWLRCMREAMDEIGLEGPLRDWFYMRLTQVAEFMVNTAEGPTTSAE